MRQESSAFTVCISCYNGERFLKTCLECLLSQTVSGELYKVIFINDGSTDGSLKIVKPYERILGNFRLLDNRKNIGLTRSCNRALNIIDTPYLMRLDCDDYLSPNAVRNILRELNSAQKTDFVIFNRWDVLDEKLKKVSIKKDIFSWIAAGVIFRTEAVRSVGGYSNEHWEEYDLYLKLLEEGFRYRISPYRIYYYRKGHRSMTQDIERNRKGFESLIRKWGLDILGKYGNFENLLRYYQIGRREARCPG